ncbi:glycosyltransferase [Verrucomicrobiales bacterium]|nr:glycosyltransferase [Verrucomicrobiales bacterium]
MKKFIIDLSSASTGGGYYIGKNLINAIKDIPNNTNQYIIIVNENLLSEGTNLILFKKVSNNFYLSKIKVFYYLYLRHPCHYLINPSDIIWPFRYNQTFYFDWSLLFESKLKQLKFKRKIKWIFMRLSIYSPRKILVQTDILKQQFKTCFNKCNVNILPLPVNENEISSALSHKGVKSKKIIFLYPAVFSEYKNHAFLFDIAKKLWDVSPECIFYLTIDDQSYVSMVDKYKVKNVENIGFISRSKILQEMANADFLFFPSKSESYCLPILEAFALRIPVISIAAPYTENFGGGRTIILLDPFDIDYSVDLILSAIDSDNSLRINQAFERLNDLPSWQSFTETILDN